MPAEERLAKAEQLSSSRIESGKVATISNAASDTYLPPPTLSESESLAHGSRSFVVGGVKRLTGRRSMTSSPLASPEISAGHQAEQTSQGKERPTLPAQQGSHRGIHHSVSNSLGAQVLGWLRAEKGKRLKRDGQSQLDSTSSDLALEKLEQILAEHMVLDKDGLSVAHHESTGLSPRKPSMRILRSASTTASSDTEFGDGDAVVPSVDALLDNSKTISYAGGITDPASDLTISPAKRAIREREGWLLFKAEILRLAHTLRLKGWRRVPLERGREIDVERLSGALTNAVYVVSPPQDFLTSAVGGSIAIESRKPPPKLLLRVYGPQADHLIDRKNELQVLRRLARKRIGPRLLGTFTNGRFEEYFHARTLNARDLRIPETSKQIAKRMRELHDGMELLTHERDAGPFVWKNWDKWVTRCEEVITWLDRQIISTSSSLSQSRHNAWKLRGLVCGVEWKVFRATVDRYRQWLEVKSGGKQQIKQILVFAHNDTQYGNLLRLEPPGESPLLLPANEHKQLVVIDFEYASANPRGLEFANHFTEWCYNYHDATRSHACDTKAYPRPDEQRRFISAYVSHRPQYQAAAPSITTKILTNSPSSGPTTSVSAFMLDNRIPSTQSMLLDEQQRDREQDERIDALMFETRLWRAANSAQWVAWGIVQAHVAGMGDNEEEETSVGRDGKTAEDAGRPMSDPPTASAMVAATAADDKRPEAAVVKASAGEGSGAATDDAGEEKDEDGFNYLAYAQERAMFFWGDVVGSGLIRIDDLPAEVREKIKLVPY